MARRYRSSACSRSPCADDGLATIRAPAHAGGTDPNEAEHITVQFTRASSVIQVWDWIPALQQYQWMNTVHCYIPGSQR
ncbi:hypothetical protein M405DRAFT_815977 [Rhizopogon salebrosus TDB-379]|nr:hypothetical protein M405DRAFT_815977 [Rhizopogon salebrosus TDB-379]